MKFVMIDPGCFFNMVFSCIEVYNRETTGFLMGNKRRRTINRRMENMVACEIAYPLQTASRKPTSVGWGNARAFKRVRSLVPSLNLSLVGEYHSHTSTDADLSEDDRDYIEERMEQIYETGENLVKNCWLELVISIRQRHYESPHKVGWSWADYAKKARCIVKTSPYAGYDMTFGGYWVYKENSRIKKSETIIYIPWVKDYWA